MKLGAIPTGNFYLGLTVLILTVLTLVLVFKNRPKEEMSRICFKNYCFEVEIADTPEKRVEGLSFRQDLAEDKGMLFIFENIGKHSFWMKHTLIPLDIIWLDENYRVVFIKERAAPCDKDCPSLMPDKEALYVLELSGGSAERMKLGLGAQLVFNP